MARQDRPNQTSSRPFWSKVNSIRSNKSASKRPHPLHHNGQVTKSAEGVAGIFGSTLAATLQGSTAPHDVHLQPGIDEENNIFLNDKSYGHIETSNIELHLIAKQLKSSSAPGQSGVSNAMLKHLPDNILTIIVRLINITLRAGVVPTDWKHAQVSMLPKGKGLSTDPNNYRPISLTCCLCKLAERVIHKHIYSHLERVSFFIDNQSGFRSKRRTTDNLFYLSQ